MLKRLIFVSLMAVYIGQGVYSLDISPEGYIKPQVPKLVDESLKIINDGDEEVALGKYKGKFIVIYFWQKTNNYSLEGLLRLKKLAALFKHDEDVAFISVYQPTEVPAVLTERVIRRRVGIYDVGFYKATASFMSYFNVGKFPTTYFINEKFELIARLPSFWNLMHEDMIEIIDTMLQGRFKTLKNPSLWQKFKNWAGGLFSKKKG